MLTNCFRFAPRDSVPGLIAKICKYLKDHPGWSEEELEEQIKQFIGQTGVESFNGRTGAVVLNEDDVNNLKIASAYFAEGNETIDELDLVSLYNQGVRFVFTNWNSVTSGYDLTFVLDYFSGSNDVVYYPMATGSGGGGDIISVNGKTGVVELSLSDILGDSGAQVKLCTATEFTSTTAATWNAYYEDGYRIVGVVNSNATAIDYIYLLKQDENNHQPIGLSAGASNAYTPSNPPPYPVTSVNGKTGDVTGLYGAENPPPYPVTSVNGKTGAIIGLYSAENPPPYPVKSVNGKTGDVTIESGVSSVNGKTGDVTGLYSAENPPPYPVASVNGMRGNVTGLYSAGNPPPYPVTCVNGLTGSIITVQDLYVPATATGGQYILTLPRKSVCIARSILNPFTENSSTLPSGNEDGITLETAGGIYPGELIAAYYTRGYIICRDDYVSSNKCILKYKNFGSSASPLKYNFDVTLINTSDQDISLTVKGYY